MKNKKLRLDIETYCELDLKKVGVYRYAEHKSFEILMVAYKYDDDKTKIIDLASGDSLPKRLQKDIVDSTVEKHAFNAQFERVCFGSYFDRILHPNSWHCTQVLGAMAGLPFGLDNVAKALNTFEQKDKEGKALIRYFSMPCKATKTNGGRTRNMPWDSPEKWQSFLDYCVQDVDTEAQVANELRWFKVPSFEREMYVIDQIINDRGVLIDMDITNNAVAINDIEVAENIQKIKDKYGVTNAKSAAQIKKFIFEKTGIEVSSIAKSYIDYVLAQFESDEEVTGLLNMRSKVTRTSISKFTAIQNAICDDSRLRGILQYYGANRTGRWAGRIFQPQNIKRNNLNLLDEARELVRTNDVEMLSLLYDDLGDVLSNLIRTCLIPQKGGKFIINDFSAIEARVLAWLAGEQWVLDVFNTHGKIYEATASKMFNVPIEQVTKGSDLRNKGKIAQLALGYQGWTGALRQMGGEKMGLSEDDMRQIAGAWRNANPNIRNFWKSCEQHVRYAIQVQSCRQKSTGIEFHYDKRKNLSIKLPSGRLLCYFDAKLVNDEITYMGLEQQTKRWVRLNTYGGKIVENITQAVARDLLADVIVRAHKAGFNIVLHVHDEIVVDEKDASRADELNDIMQAPIPWAKGLPLKGDPFEADYYQK